MIYDNQYIYSYFSQKTEQLCDQLIDNLTHCTDPFEKNIILVPNSGMQRYLEIMIAKKFGICSHITISYPGSFLWSLYKDILIEINHKDINSKRLLTFEIYNILQAYQLDLDFKEIIPKNSSQEQIFYIAQTVANYFNRYNSDRPELIKAWEKNLFYTKNKHEKWQRKIYQNIYKKIDSQYRLQKSFHESLTDEKLESISLPKFIHLFGFHALPVNQLNDFLVISQYTGLLFYTINPSVEYWGDLRQQSKGQLNLFDEQIDESIYFSSGNPLLASWGQSGQFLIDWLSDFQVKILDDNSNDSNLLYFIQKQIKLLAPTQNPTNIKNSKSIEIHIASSRYREIEILYDQLLTAFDQGYLAPKDVLVIMPNIHDYREIIHSIFASKNGRFYIPYTISNQSVGKTQQESQALINTLSLIENNFQRSDFLKWCQNLSIKSKFKLEEDDISIIEQWLYSEHVSWGLNTKHKSRLIDDPKLNQQGHLQKMLDSLYLGDIFYSPTTYNNIDSSEYYNNGQYETLAKLAKIINTLTPFAYLGTEEKSIKDWYKLLQQMNTSIVVEQEEITTNKLIEKWYSELSHLSNKTYTFNIIYKDIHNLLDCEELRGPFLSGSVSFCSASPMRAVPKKWIYLLGMNEDFPLSNNNDELNLIQDFPKKSDYSHLKEGKYFFLESLLSARERLFISYIGICDKTAQKLAPSPMVNDLITYLGKYIKREQFIFQHPLQAFSNDFHLPSYHHVYCSSNKYKIKDIVIDDNTESIKTNWKIDEISQIFKVPLVYNYLKRKLDVQLLPYSFDIGSDHEFISPNSLEKWILEKEFITKYSQKDFEQYLTKTNRNLPQILNSALIYQLSKSTSLLKDTYNDINHLNNQLIKGFLDIDNTNYRLFYNLNIDLDSHMQCIFKPSKVSFYLTLSGWIRHLVASTIAPYIQGRLICKTNSSEPMIIKFDELDKKQAITYLTYIFEIAEICSNNPIAYQARITEGIKPSNQKKRTDLDIWERCAKQKGFYNEDKELINKIEGLILMLTQQAKKQ